MFNTPIACVFLGNRLIVYYFNPGGPRGAPLMRTVVTSTEKVDTKDLPAATAPNGYTQLSAFINPNSINPTGISGDVIITYVESGSNQIIQYTDSLDFS
ncbi:hypothetical protein BJF96_g10319 [Aspergillus terreus]|uniref:Uncharacterized protein n=1 Tax=Aspergillus terreus TaxID=33178 RepID=A0A5M3YY92_ASPTE|nr:hypothetical protein ATETN484_0006011600 [Aspergillus terreus]GFF19857.1 hypothetical protein BJF96_g10319 [Aspergillus terreus]